MARKLCEHNGPRRELASHGLLRCKIPPPKIDLAPGRFGLDLFILFLCKGEASLLSRGTCLDEVFEVSGLPISGLPAVLSPRLGSEYGSVRRSSPKMTARTKAGAAKPMA